MTKPTFIGHLASIIDDYDLFILDQWGVLHDGERAHDGAIEAMTAIKTAGKTITLVSNSSKRVSISIKRLSKLGFSSELYDHILTSGELAWQAMKTKSDPLYETLGAKCFVITKCDNFAFLEGQSLELADTLAQAEFLLVADLPKEPVESLEPILRAAAERELPMLVLNPDFASINSLGELHPTPGIVGRIYEGFGGTVKIHGKPDPKVYETCFKLAPGAQKAIAIGDSLHHDIAGANGAGIDSIFITSGIHVFELETEPGIAPTQEKIDNLCKELGQSPTYWSPRFTW